MSATDQQLFIDHIFKFSASLWLLHHGVLFCRPLDSKTQFDISAHPPAKPMMWNLYSITTNRAAITSLFRMINRYVGNLPPMPGVFPDYAAPVIREAGRELVLMRRGMPPPRTGGPPGA
jgi:hypothetical protein